MLPLGDFYTISLSQNLVPNTISDIILFHSSCMFISNINYLDRRMEVYEVVSKIFWTGAAIYTAVVVARSIGRW